MHKNQKIKTKKWQKTQKMKRKKEKETTQKLI